MNVSHSIPQMLNPVKTRGGRVRSRAVGSQTLGVGEHGASGFELGLVHEDLARSIGCDPLEGGVRCLGHAVTAGDPCRAQQSTHHVGFQLIRDRGDYRAVIHAGRLLDERHQSIAVM